MRPTCRVDAVSPGGRDAPVREAPLTAAADCAASPGLTGHARGRRSRLSDEATGAKSRWVVTTRYVPKPWAARSTSLTSRASTGKLLRIITAGHALSLQLHRHKDETIALQSGRLLVKIGESVSQLDTFEFAPGETIRIYPGMVHRMTARGCR